MTTPAIGHAADLLIDLALQIPGAANPIEARAGSVRIGTIICRRQLPLHPFERKRGFDGLLAIGRPHRRDGVELAIKLSLKQILGRGPRLAKVDHRGIAKRAETDAYNFDVVRFGAQKVNVAIAGNCHETPGQRRVFQRQLKNAFELAVRRVARHEGRGPSSRIWNILAQDIEAITVVDFEKLYRAQLVRDAQAELGNGLVVVHGLDFDANAAVTFVGNDVGNHRSLAVRRDILPVGLPGFSDDRGAGVLIEQISRASRRLRAHLRESRAGDLLVYVAREDLLELNHTVVEAAE